jgi:hypothetical protein
MTKFSRPRSWVEHRLADALDIDGAAYTVDLVARRGTGTAGYRMTVVYIPHAGGRDTEVELGQANTTAEIHARVRELAGADERLGAVFREAGAP